MTKAMSGRKRIIIPPIIVFMRTLNSFWKGWFKAGLPFYDYQRGSHAHPPQHKEGFWSTRPRTEIHRFAFKVPKHFTFSFFPVPLLSLS